MKSLEETLFGIKRLNVKSNTFPEWFMHYFKTEYSAFEHSNHSNEFIIWELTTYFRKFITGFFTLRNWDFLSHHKREKWDLNCSNYLQSIKFSSTLTFLCKQLMMNFEMSKLSIQHWVSVRYLNENRIILYTC